MRDILCEWTMNGIEQMWYSGEMQAFTMKD